MFGRRSNNTLQQGRIQTLIGHGCEIRGTIQSTGVVRVDGRLVGTVQHAGTLIIGPKAKVEANIHAKALAIAGEVKGDLTVEGRLELLSSARVHGSIRCGTLVVHEGAVFLGRSAMGEARTDDEARPDGKPSHAETPEQDEEVRPPSVKDSA